MKKKKGPLILTGVLVILLILYFGLSSWNKKQDKKEEKETTLKIIGTWKISDGFG